MYEISVEAEFRARHQLRWPDGTAEEPHEHAWGVVATFRAPALDSSGILVDFLAARRWLDEAVARLDGADLHTCPEMQGLNPTAEHVARIIFDLLARAAPRPELLCSVQVREAEGCTARYTRD